ncbi:MAG: VWA domain-containing protein [Chthoniobacterales bacterium]
MEKTALTFGHSVWFLALALIPALVVLLFWAQKNRETLLSRIIAPRLKEALVGAVSLTRRWIRNSLLLASLSCIILALAQPRYGFNFREVTARGRDVIIAIDTSRSMLSTDISPNRLTRAKLVAQDMVHLLQGDRIGLIAFAGSSFLEAPLTLDYSAVENAIDILDTNVIPKGGTNIASAIQMALEAFGKAEGSTRALILMTDGEELDADSVAAAKEAMRQGVRIFTVGIGSAEGSVIPIEAEGGGTELVRDDAGNIVHSKLDTKRLQEIAKETGGFYEPLSTETAREILSKGIDPMQSKDFSAVTSREPIERYAWPLSAGIILLVLALMIGDRRRNVKRPASLSTKQATIALLFLITASSYGQINSGIKKYNAEDYKAALHDFERDLARNNNNAAIQFDAGVAAYKIGSYDKAMGYFTKAMLANDQKLRNDAEYNLGNTLTRKSEAAKEKDQKVANWKDAIQHYGEVLKHEPANTNAKFNKELVEKMLKDLKKQQPPPPKDQQNKDQQNKDQQNKDQQNKDQQNKDQQNKDQQNKDQQNKDQQNKDQQDKSGQPTPTPRPSGGDKQNSGQSQNATPTPTPGEKKTGELKSANPEKTDDKKQEAQKAGAQAGEETKDGQMSAAQAEALLRSLQGEEEKVMLNRRNQEEVNKDW